MIKVSIITIVYNNKEFIADCLNSVKKQSYANIEHIVIDGGSSDGTQEIIAPFVSDLGFYISEKDTGLYNALNKGIANCSGDVIGLLHSDDFFYDTQTVAKVAKKFEESCADLVYANGMYVDRKNTSLVKRIYKSKKFKKRYLKWGWIPLHTTIYVKKSIFDQFGIYNESYRIASDYEISLRWFFNKKINKSFLNQWVVKMRLGGKSTTAKLQNEKSREDFKIIQNYPLFGIFSLVFKIIRKIPQYIFPRLKDFN